MSRVAIAAALLGAGGLVLGACSSSPSSGGASTSSPTSTTFPSGKLGRIEAAVSKESSASFKVVYRTTGASGLTSVTIEQLPPKQVFTVTGSGSAGATRVIYDGKKAYSCRKNKNSPAICIAYPSPEISPLGAIVCGYTAHGVAATLQVWQSELASGISGYQESFSTKSFAGQSAQCVTWTYKGTTTKYCVTASGVIAYGSVENGASKHGFEMTAYSTSPPASDFSLPEGATVETIPSD